MRTVAAVNPQMATMMAGLPPAMARTLARCALVRGFDRDMYETVLRDPDGPDFDELAASPLAEREPGTLGEYRLLGQLGTAAWSSWWGTQDDPGVPPQPLCALATAVARYCGGRGRDVEALRALLVCDQTGAVALFERLFTARDEQLDLPGCQDLLDVLAEPERLRLGGPTVAALRNDRERYLNARTLWYDCLLASARYVSRPEIEESLERLLSAAPAQAMRLHASGGMGKSTTVQWFIARRCVPDRVPCALIDLDAVDPVNATRHPWLVVLEAAAQLNLQMDGAPFQELLRDYSAYRSVLVRQPTELSRSGAAAISREDWSQVDTGDVHRRFVRALTESTRDRPVLVVIDTFEEAVLRPAGTPDALVTLLAALHRDAPALRLVLSGRRSRAEDDVTCLARHFPPAVMPAVEIAPFDAEQSRRYLTEARGLPAGPLTEVMVANAGGRPWVLGLYADLALHSTSVDRETIERFDPGIAWCVDRVIGRIEDDALQWLVRYGVVPRRLRRTFAERIVLPRMAASMSGSDDDRPELDERPAGDRPVFRTGIDAPDGPAQFDVLWNALLRYTNDSSWVSISPTDHDTVLFHPAVVEPLRHLLAAKPVCSLLHRDAIAYYEGLATADPAGTGWLREAVYHRFQLDGAAAAGYWRAAIRRVQNGHAADRVVELAGEVLSPEYVDEDGRPRELASGRLVIDAQVQAEAYTVRAWGLSQVARDHGFAGGHQTWSEVERALAEASRLRFEHPEVRLPDTMCRVAEGALAVARGDTAAATTRLAPLLDSADDSRERCGGLLIYAEACRLRHDHDRAEIALHAAQRLSGRIGDHALTARIAAELSAAASAQGQFDTATTWIGAAGRIEHPDTRLGAEIGLTAARTALRAGLPGTAQRLAAVPPDADPEARHVEVQARALIALQRPYAAVRVCDAGLAREGLLRERKAALRAMRGRAYGELLDVDHALADLSGAQERYLKVRDNAGAAACCVATARVHLEALGDLRDAGRHLDEAAHLLPEPGTPAWVAGQLLRARLAARCDDGDLAADTCLAVLREARRRDADPELVVDAAVHGLALASRTTADFADALLDTLGRVAPASARLRLLPSLALCRDELPVATDLARLALENGEPPAAADPQDAAALALLAADVYRLTGELDKALEVATQATEALARRDPFVRWWWLRFVSRLPSPPRGVPAGPLRGHADRPLLQAAYLITTASCRLAAGDLDGLATSLDAAEHRLAASHRVSHWDGELAVLRHRLAQRSGDAAEAARQLDTAHRIHVDLGADPGEHQPETPSHTWHEVTLGAACDGAGAVQVTATGTPLGSPRPWRARIDIPALCGRLDARSYEDDAFATLTASGFMAADGGKVDPLLDAERHRPVDVCVATGSASLAQLPWESVATRNGTLVTDPRVRFVYRTPERGCALPVQERVLRDVLARAGFPHPTGETAAALLSFQQSVGLVADGVAGPDTWGALRQRLVENPSERRRRVMLMRRDARHDLDSKRGYQSTAGYDPVWTFRARGWDVTVVENPESVALASAATADPPDVLYLNATMESTGRATPYLDFGGGAWGQPWQESADESVGITALDSLLRGWTARGRTPLVVLDIVAPHVSVEQVRQGMLRNDFAYQLVTVGGAVTVLVTGGITGPDRVAASEHVVERMSAGRTAADVARSLQRFESGWLRSADPDRRWHLPYGMTALFSAVKPDALLPIGL